MAFISLRTLLTFISFVSSLAYISFITSVTLLSSVTSFTFFFHILSSLTLPFSPDGTGCQPSYVVFL